MLRSKLLKRVTDPKCKCKQAAPPKKTLSAMLSSYEDEDQAHGAWGLRVSGSPLLFSSSVWSRFVASAGALGAGSKHSGAARSEAGAPHWVWQGTSLP